MDQWRGLAIPALQRHYPNCADWTRIAEDRYRDIDEQAACLTGYDQKYQQMSTGRYDGWFRTVLLGPHIGVFFETFNQALDQWGACPADCYGFVCLMENSSRCHLDSVVCDTDCIVLLGPGGGFDFRARPGTRYCVVNVAKGVFELFLRACIVDGPTVGLNAGTTHLMRNPIMAQTLRQMIHQALQIAGSFDGTRASRTVLLGFQASLVSLLASFVCGTLSHSEDLREAGSDCPARTAFTARDHVRAIGGVGITPADLALRAGVSRRKLEYLFRTHLDTSPGEYIRLVQLNEVRSALLDDANRDRSIGDIAADCGVWHLSRMARNYRIQFGELPSQTRKQ